MSDATMTAGHKGYLFYQNERVNAGLLPDTEWHYLGEDRREAWEKAWASLAKFPAAPPQPIDMILYCPACGTQHIDAADSDTSVHPDGRETRWTNPPHRSHLCASCDHIWRSADVPTNGVSAIGTRGKDDSEAVAPLTDEEIVSTARLASTSNEYEAGRVMSMCFTRQAIINFVKVLRAPRLN